MKFACYSDWSQLPQSANTLFEQAEKDSIFYSRAWFENTSKQLETGETLVIACVLAENTVMAILPLIKSGENTGYALRHRYTPLYRLLLANDNQAQVLACLVKGLSQVPFNGLLLDPVAENDHYMDRLQQALETAGFRCDRTFRFYNWILRVQGQSYSDYLAARSAKLRNTLSRKKRKLEREHGFEMRLFTGDEVLRKMSEYYAVYNASWKAREQYAGFVDKMVADFSKAGWSRLGMLYINGHPAAAQLWFVHHGKASIFRLSYDEAWKAYSPGTILTAFLMEYVIDIDKVEEVDFLFGNDAYKQDWMSDRRERFAMSYVKTLKPAGWYARVVEALKRLRNR